jgi:hypothetical protein
LSIVYSFHAGHNQRLSLSKVPIWDALFDPDVYLVFFGTIEDYEGFMNSPEKGFFSNLGFLT